MTRETTENVVEYALWSRHVAKMLSCSPTTVARFRKEGKLKAKKIGGSYRYSEEQVKSIIDDAASQ